MIDELPADIRALITAEQAAPVPGSAVQHAVRAKVAGSMAHVALGHAASGVVLKLVVLAVVAGGAIVGYHATTRASAPATTTIELPATLSERASDDVAIEVASTSVPETAPPVPAALPPVAAPVPPPPGLSDAWLDLSAGRAADALEIVQHDLTLHPHSPLDEERRALEIAALVALGRSAEARTDAQLFLATYPHSIHERMVRNALQGGSR